MKVDLLVINPTRHAPGAFPMLFSQASLLLDAIGEYFSIPFLVYYYELHTCVPDVHKCQNPMGLYLISIVV
uniref:AlNc14C89G5631 protein n=1 Tax=Albugo laibachii Nc14 TaxID=890382 RepID=F0WGA1_9STRA|nr:AlNc14C89G5631 [Albugo laibachii Nc14]|eukprot:CCA20236.1 AlNc14C89G5631 [Albugo laibachii Nc14]